MMALSVALAGMLAMASSPQQAGASVAASPLADQANAAAPIWSFRQNRLTHVPTGISFPSVVSDETFAKIGISSHHGTGLDDVLEWQTPGRESYISVFVFRPSLADAGLSAAITDAVIRHEYGSETQTYDDRVVPVGGSPGIARRTFYEKSVIGGRQIWTGSASFKVGAWLIVVRISGPAEKRLKLEEAMSELLSGLRFSPGTPPHPFHAIKFDDCPALGGAIDAKRVSIEQTQAAAMAAIVSAVDSGVSEQERGRSKQSDLTRVPDHLCRHIVNTEHGPRLELWPPNDRAGGFPLTRIAGMVLLDDAGTMVEIVRAGNTTGPYYVVSHAIGEGRMGAAIDSPPSSSQYRALADGTSTLLSPTSTRYEVDSWGHIKVESAAERPGVK